MKEAETGSPEQPRWSQNVAGRPVATAWMTASSGFLSPTSDGPRSGSRGSARLGPDVCRSQVAKRFADTFAMRTRCARTALCLVVLCCGCASSGVIRGTLSVHAPTGSAIRQGPNSARASAPASVSDAVIYIEEVRPRGESRLLAGHASSSPRLECQTLRPRIIVVAVGTSVEFPNDDSLFHSIFSVSPAKPFELGRYGRGRLRRARRRRQFRQ